MFKHFRVTRCAISLSLLISVCYFVTGAADQSPPPPLTLATLLTDATDLATLCELPPVPFTAHQVSSYDRLSLSADDPEGWFANHDRGHCLYEGTLEKETPYARTPPRRDTQPAGRFPAGTKVGIARQRRLAPGFLWVYATDSDGKPGLPPLQGYVRQEMFTPSPTGPVLADIAGPGCLTRIWSSNPGEAGLVRIFLDDQPSPVIEAKLADLLAGRWEVNRGTGKTILFPPPFAGERARGYTLLVPIPFARRCLVTIERPMVQFQINYRRYPPGTQIETLSIERCLQQRDRLTALAQTLDALPPPEPVERAKMLGRLREDEIADVQRVALDKPALEPGETRRLDLLEPPGASPSRAIIQLRCQVQGDVLPEALRTTLLSITFDNAPRPQVRVPLGDFFGTAPGANGFTTLPTRATARGQLTAHWIMPYARNARLEVTNLGTATVTVQLEAIHVPRPWSPRSLHFHARWRCDSLATRPVQDWPLIKITGAGHYVGTALSVYNPVKDWWGEGDTKVWVDGEAFPSHWGTGTDDDFGCGWADRTLFHHAWHAQSRRDGASHQGFASLFRCQLLDRIPFTKSLQFSLEVRHDQAGQRVQYAAVSYWYARPGCSDDAPELTAESVRQTIAGGQP